MSIGKRILWMVLLLTVVAALWPVPEDNTAADVAPRPATGRNRASILANAPAQQIRPLTLPVAVRDTEIVDLFVRQGWIAPAANAAPEKPTAPALPFTYAGRYTEGSSTIVYLNEGVKMHQVREGDTVNATYRIDSITPAAVTLTYLPLGLRQTLQTGSTTPQ